MNFDGELRPGDYATARITVPAVPAKLVYDPALAGKYISPMHPQVIRDQAGTVSIVWNGFGPHVRARFRT